MGSEIMFLNLIKVGGATLALVAIPVAAQIDARAQTYDRPVRVTKRAHKPAPTRSWSGLYAGVNVGYGLAGVSDNTPLAVSSLMTGVIGGAQIGYNWQTDSLVFGLEADIQYSAQSVTYSQSLPIVGSLTIGHKIPYFGTVRGRVGYAFTCGCVMAYATGGVAYGAYQLSASAFGITLSETFTRAAAVVGAGVEWRVSQSWSAKLEALYIDTGNVGVGTPLPVVGTVHMRVRDAITRLGLNYHF